ncbi:MAG: DUF1467 family protein [Rickettsiales bacterium]
MVVFVCIWWIIFFMALPFRAQITEKPELGHADSAPTNPHLKIKVIITTIISALLTKVIVDLIEKGYMAEFAENFNSWISSY